MHQQYVQNSILQRNLDCNSSNIKIFTKITITNFLNSNCLWKYQLYHLKKSIFNSKLQMNYNNIQLFPEISYNIKFLIKIARKSVQKFNSLQSFNSNSYKIQLFSGIPTVTFKKCKYLQKMLFKFFQSSIIYKH